MYLPRDHWMICDRCGSRNRFSEMREEWTGLWNCKKCYEERHPQDFVEGVEDDPTVPIAFPDDKFLWGKTTLRLDADRNTSFIQLTDSTGIKEGDPIGITLNNETVHWTFIIRDPISNDVRISDYIPFDAIAGNVVWGPFVGSGSTTEFIEEVFALLPIYTETLGPLMNEDLEYIATEIKLLSSDYVS